MPLEGNFPALYRALPDWQFREGLRTLYLMSQAQDSANENVRTRIGTRHVVESFDFPEAGPVIDRWYRGNPTQD